MLSKSTQSVWAVLAILLAQGIAATEPVRAEAAPRWPFRIVIVPDTQRYTTERVYFTDSHKKGDKRRKLNVEERNKIFEQMMQWIVDHKENENIRLVLHVGDLVETPRDRRQYAMIDKGIALLDGKTPYVLAIGNHDDSELASEFFPVKRNPLNARMPGAMRIPGDIGDRYATITINGQKYLILTLSYHGLSRAARSSNNERLTWANTVTREHRDHKVIFLTHALLSESPKPGGEPTLARAGKKLFEVFVTRHENMHMTFCGHVQDRTGDGIATGYRKDIGHAGNTIHSAVFNTQWIDKTGGDGWLRIVEFHHDGRVVHKSYSPYLDRWHTGAGFTFEIAAEKARSPREHSR